MTRIVSLVRPGRPTRHTSRWLLISLAAVILCSCRGVDSQIASVPSSASQQPAVTTPTALTQAMAAVPEAAVPDTQSADAIQSLPAKQSLSDHNHATAASPTHSVNVSPVGHTTPVVPTVLPADGAMFVQPPPASAAQMMVQVSPTPAAPPYSAAASPAYALQLAQSYGPAYGVLLSAGLPTVRLWTADELPA